MAAKRRNRPDYWEDQNYPFPMEKNSAGETVYYVPEEADSADSLVTLNAKKHGGRRMIHFGPCKMYVVFVPTTNAKFAYDQKKWLNAQHTKNRRWRDRMVYLDGMMVTDTDDEIYLSENPVYKAAADPFEELLLTDLKEKIGEYIDAKHPRNPRYREIYQLLIHDFSLSEIARQYGISVPTVLEYKRKICDEINEYIERYVED